MTCSVCFEDAFNQKPGSWIIQFPYVYCSKVCLRATMNIQHPMYGRGRVIFSGPVI